MEKCKNPDCNSYFIENKKYGLCPLHNWLRIHKDKTESDYYNRYNKGFKITKPMKQISKKEQQNKINLSRIYDEIDRERGFMCEGCGNSNFLSHSHLISRNDRKDLESDKRNIKIHCMQRADGSKGCHARWEGSLIDKQTLLDFEENMIYIKSVDEKQYNLILLK